MANALHHKLAAMKTEFKTMYNRFCDYEIGLELPKVLDDRISEINVSYSRCYVYFTSYILIWKNISILKKKEYFYSSDIEFTLDLFKLKKIPIKFS